MCVCMGVYACIHKCVQSTCGYTQYVHNIDPSNLDKTDVASGVILRILLSAARTLWKERIQAQMNQWNANMYLHYVQIHSNTYIYTSLHTNTSLGVYIQNMIITCQT